MENKDFQSFETVDLFSPVELVPIQGIEAPFKAPEKIEEPRKAPEKVDELQRAPEKVDELQRAPEKVDELQRAPEKVEKPRKNLEEIEESQNTPKKVEESRKAPETIGDPRRFFREEEALRRKLRDKNRTRNGLIATGIIFSLLMMVIVYVIRFSITNSLNQNDYRVIDNPADRDVFVMNDYIGQDDVYGTVSLNDEDIPASDLVKINPDVIEYTGMYYRSLYIIATPKADNVVTEIAVEMIDRYGNSLGKCINVMDDVPAGKEGIVEVSFGINPYDDLNGVSYSINFDIFRVDQELSQKNITGITGQDGIVWAKIEGDESVRKSAYAVFYKDGNVVSVLYEQARHDLDDIVVFETGKIDFDYFKVFY